MRAKLGTCWVWPHNYEALSQHKVVHQLVVLPVAFVQPHCVLLLVLLLLLLLFVSQGGDLYSALRHHSETMKWERLGRKVALDVALGLNYLHAQVGSCNILHCLRAIPVLIMPRWCTTQSVCL